MLIHTNTLDIIIIYEYDNDMNMECNKNVAKWLGMKRCFYAPTSSMRFPSGSAITAS